VVVVTIFILFLIFKCSASGIVRSRLFVLIYVLNNNCGMATFNKVNLFFGSNNY